METEEYTSKAGVMMRCPGARLHGIHPVDQWLVHDCFKVSVVKYLPCHQSRPHVTIDVIVN